MIYFITAMIITCLLLGAVLFFVINRRWKSFLVQRRFIHGQKGEEKAKDILESYGYTLVEEQKNITMAMYVNGRRINYKVRPDGVAFKDGKKFIVEVKTGTSAPNPLYSNTRRQLLEYYFSFQSDGILLVDADQNQVLEVNFERKDLMEKFALGKIFKNNCKASFFSGILFATVFFMFIIYFFILK